MGGETKTVEHGGGPAVPLAEDFTSILMNFLQTGQFGATPPRNRVLEGQIAELDKVISAAGSLPGGRGHLPRLQAERDRLAREASFGVGGQNGVGRATGAFETLNRLLSGADLTGMGESISSIIEKDIGRGSADLRERFTAGGGGGIGTPEAVAESLFRSEAAPRKGLALGQLDLQNRGQQAALLSNLLQLIAAMSGKGISQAQSTAFFDPGIAANIAGFLGGAGQAAAGIAAL